MKIRSLIFTFLCFAGQYATAHSVDYSTTLLRKWHLFAEHKTLEGSFYLCKNGNVFVEDARNQVVQFPLVDLSKEDQAYVAETLARIEQLQANPTPSPGSRINCLRSTTTRATSCSNP